MVEARHRWSPAPAEAELGGAPSGRREWNGPAARESTAGEREPRYRFVKSRWLLAVFEFVTIPLVVRLNRAVRTAAGEAVGLPCR